jgi:integrase
MLGLTLIGATQNLWSFTEAVAPAVAPGLGMTETRFNFTGDRLRNHPPPTRGRVRLYDLGRPGLILEITSNGAKSFRVYRKFKGRPVNITLGRFDPAMIETRDLPAGSKPLDVLGNSAKLNVKMARKVANAVIAELDAGKNPAEAFIGNEMTLGQLFERYRAHLIAEGKKGVAGTTWCFQRYVGALPDEPRKRHGQERAKAPGGVNWQRRLLSSIEQSDISQLRLDVGRRVGHTTANRVVELLRAMFNFALKQRLYAGENSAAHVGKYKIASRERFLRADELPKFLKALDDEEQNFADYVMLSILIGARRGNILRMRWDELSLDGARWTISGELMKNGEQLSIPLVKEAVDILKRRAGERGKNAKFVFPGRTPHGHAGPFRKQWAQLVARAGVPDLHVHDLRRSLGSWMAGSGASTVMTMRALGHKSINAALIYQRLADEPVRHAMQAGVSALLKAGKKRSK